MGHAVQLYEDEAFLVERVARFLEEGLRAGAGILVVATPPHRQAIAARLRAFRLNVGELSALGRYVAVDAADVLACIVENGAPTVPRFQPVVGPLIERVAGPNRRPVRIFGEMVALLAAADRLDAALALERLWNGVVGPHCELLCGYPLAAFSHDVAGDGFARMSAEHSTVTPSDGYGCLTDVDGQLREVARLQQAVVRLPSSDEWLQAQELQARYAAIVESSDDAIVSKTLDGIVTSWNAGAERIFGYRAEEMIGQPIARLIPPDRRDDFRSILDTIRVGGRLDHFETQRLRKDGTRIHVSLTVSPVKDASGRVIGASKIARDITKRIEAEAERETLLAMARRAQYEAETANRAKDEFLAMLGHELRNPLAAVRNAITSARLDSTQRERSLEIAARQADQLTRLVDDLLDVARITHGRIPLRTRPVRVGDVVSRAVESVTPLVEDRGIALSVSTGPETPVVKGDSARLEQVLVNILGNAAKFTPHGGHIRVEVERDEGDVVLRVVDTGIGIEPEMVGRVCDLFVQARTGLDRARGGLGIGLTIVKKLVDLHGGRVSVWSEGVGKGTEVVVRLPASVEDDLGVEPCPGAQPSGTANVLIVEDNVDAAESLTLLLQIQGHRVALTHDGLAGLAAARRRVPDVMLVDIGLPGVDGFEVARTVRRDPALKGVYVVALTGYGRDVDQRAALDAGFDEFMVKPVEPERLYQLVARIGSG